MHGPRNFFRRERDFVFSPNGDDLARDDLRGRVGRSTPEQRGDAADETSQVDLDANADTR
ncbi:MAG: hypothetical protein RQ830_06285 [Tepidimonas sp.]|nr:hypothetical protein [Tepidimonas sp.]